MPVSGNARDVLTSKVPLPVSGRASAERWGGKSTPEGCVCGPPVACRLNVSSSMSRESGSPGIPLSYVAGSPRVHKLNKLAYSEVYGGQSVIGGD